MTHMSDIGFFDISRAKKNRPSGKFHSEFDRMLSSAHGGDNLCLILFPMQRQSFLFV